MESREYSKVPRCHMQNRFPIQAKTVYHILHGRQVSSLWTKTNKPNVQYLPRLYLPDEMSALPDSICTTISSHFLFPFACPFNESG
jgi:hypothetical protein